VPDHKEGYVTASIESVDEKKGLTKVKKSNGEVNIKLNRKNLNFLMFSLFL